MSVPDASRAFIVFLTLAPVLYALCIIPMWWHSWSILKQLVPWAWNNAEMIDYWHSPWSWALGPLVRILLGMHIAAWRHPHLKNTAMRLPMLVGATTGLIILDIGLLVSTLWHAMNGHLTAEIARPRRHDRYTGPRYYWIPQHVFQITGHLLAGAVVKLDSRNNLFDCNWRVNLAVFIGMTHPRLNKVTIGNLRREVFIQHALN